MRTLLCHSEPMQVFDGAAESMRNPSLRPFAPNSILKTQTVK